MEPKPGAGPLAQRIAAAKAAAEGKATATTEANPAAAVTDVTLHPLPKVEKGEKLYHHRVHGANFIMPDGKVLTFLGGSYKTSDPKIIEELDKVANVPSSYIHTTPTPIEAMEERALRKDMVQAAETTFDTVNKLPAGAKTVAMPMAQPQVSTLTDGGGDAKAE